MENILKLLLGFGFIILVSYLVYQIFVQASSDTYVRLTSEISDVSAGNAKLKETNDLLRVRIEALRVEPRAIEPQIWKMRNLLNNILKYFVNVEFRAYRLAIRRARRGYRQGALPLPIRRAFL